MSSQQLSPPVFSLPNKKVKMTPPSPPSTGPACPPPLGVKEDGPSIFDVLNIFRHCWFLNWDHLIANFLSAQKNKHGKIIWVDFQPPFHTHLIWRALALLPALCPIVKGKHCMFVFILEVLDGNGPGSFFSLEKATLMWQYKKGPKPSAPSMMKPYSGPPISPLICPSKPLGAVWADA